MIKAVVSGAAGRMGSSIIRLINKTEDIEIGGALEQVGHPLLGHDAGGIAGLGSINVKIGHAIDDLLNNSDVVIDFSTPQATLSYLEKASTNRVAMVIGTTGFTKDEEERIRQLAEDIPCVLSPNMSVGVNLIFRVIQDIARVLGDEYDIEIVEAHHRHKKDAPSGTAIRMAQILADTLGRDLSRVGRFSRHGITGERDRREIGVQSLRAGDIVGDHTVLFGGAGERIEITHRAHSRDTFASGAIRAARWVVHQKPGIYSMLDVLGSKT